MPYVTSGNAWPGPQLITISFVPDGTLLGSNSSGYIYSNLFATFNARWSTAVWQKQILKAAETWAQQTNINFAVVSDNGAALGTGNYQQGDPAMGDIRISGFNFGMSALGNAEMPPPANNYSIAGDISFNTGQPFNIGSTYDLYSVALHEFGHALGLYHSASGLAVMYASYTNTKSGLNSDDVAGIQAIYGGVRSVDAFDAAASNNSFATASNISAQIDPVALTSTLNNLDITSINNSSGSQTTTDVDYYTFTAPVGSTHLTVEVQSTGLSLLAPAVTVYAADQQTVLGSASVTSPGQFGATLTVEVSNVSAGQQFYVKVSGASSTVLGSGNNSILGSGEYALVLNLGAGVLPTVTLPNTQLLNGSPLSNGGGSYEREPGEPRPLGGAADVFPAATPVTAVPTGVMVVLEKAPQGTPAVFSSPAASAALPAAAAVAPAGLTLPVVPVPAPAASVPVSGYDLPAREERVVILPASADTPVLPEPEEPAAPVPDAPAEASATRLWHQACDACFAEEVPAVPATADVVVALAPPPDGEALGESTAGAAVLVVALGGYWGTPPEEPAGRRAQKVKL